MTFTVNPQRGSDLNINYESPTRTLILDVVGKLPYAFGGDAFDYVASLVMAKVQQDHSDYNTPVGRIYWNSIQLTEQYYAQRYQATVTYTRLNKQTGAWQISVDQAVGNVHVTAGRRIAGFDGTGTCPDNGGVMFDGLEVTGTEIPVAEDRISISYRHPAGFLNAGYVLAVGTLRGFPNNDYFLGYEPGEVRYMGGNFTQTDAEASASYSFDVSRNATGIQVGDATITAKTGFDVVSPVYEPDVDANQNAVRKVLGVETIRFREWKNYKPVFGWG